MAAADTYPHTNYYFVFNIYIFKIKTIPIHAFRILRNVINIISDEDLYNISS